jgi:hypothetical protein
MTSAITCARGSCVTDPAFAILGSMPTPAPEAILPERAGPFASPAGYLPDAHESILAPPKAGQSTLRTSSQGHRSAVRMALVEVQLCAPEGGEAPVVGRP